MEKIKIQIQNEMETLDNIELGISKIQVELEKIKIMEKLKEEGITEEEITTYYQKGTIKPETYYDMYKYITQNKIETEIEAEKEILNKFIEIKNELNKITNSKREIKLEKIGKVQIINTTQKEKIKPIKPKPTTQKIQKNKIKPIGYQRTAKDKLLDLFVVRKPDLTQDKFEEKMIDKSELDYETDNIQNIEQKMTKENQTFNQELEKEMSLTKKITPNKKEIQEIKIPNQNEEKNELEPIKANSKNNTEKNIKINQKINSETEAKSNQQTQQKIENKIEILKNEEEEKDEERQQKIREIITGYKPKIPKQEKGLRKTIIKKEEKENESETLPKQLKKAMEKRKQVEENKEEKYFGKKNKGLIETIKNKFTNTMVGEEYSGNEKLSELYDPRHMTTLREKFFLGGKEHKIIESSGGKFFTLIPHYSYSQIVEEEKGNKLYFIIEPDLTEKDKYLLEIVEKNLIENLYIEDLNSRERVFEKIDKFLKNKKIVLSPEEKQKIVYYLSRDLFGLGKIEPLMHDPFIEDIQCDGVNIPLYIVHRKQGHLPTNIIYNNVGELEDFVIKLAQLSKSYVSYSAPLLDSILPDGSRVNAVLTSSVSTKGPTFTIRRFPEKPLSPIALILSKTITPEMMAYLWTAIYYKKSILLTGATASGKTTFLNALAMFIPSGKRIVSIEDTRELNLEHENWLPQVARMGFGPPDATGQKYGEVTMMDLIKASFRQRPDYLIVGEVRGEETFVLFQGMASGHTSLATMHAKSVDDVVNRLTTPPINLYPTLLESIDIIINLSFKSGEEIQRGVRTIAEVLQYNQNTKKIEFVKIFEPQNHIEYSKKEAEPEEILLRKLDELMPLASRSHVLKKISAEYGISIKEIQAQVNRRKKLLEELTEQKIVEYEEFYKKIEEFAKNENQ